jgi:YidC/Oxa1 family membrane protein insertase
MGAISSLFGYLLNALYTAFNNYGIAIIVFSIILRIILIPLTIKQQKSLKKSAQLQEEMKEIQRKYKNNPEKLNQETIDLYKREKLSPFAGCFSSIIQIVIILSVFWLVSQPLTYMKKIDTNVINDYKTQIQESGEQATYAEIAIINKYGTQDARVSLNMDFLGLDLSKVPSSNLRDWTVYIIPLLYVISSVVSIKINNNMTKKKKDDKKAITDGTNMEVQNEPNEMEAMEAMNKNMMYMIPLMSVFIAFIAPLGLALYWFISNVLIIIEKLIIDAVIKHKEEKQNV